MLQVSWKKVFLMSVLLAGMQIPLNAEARGSAGLSAGRAVARAHHSLRRKSSSHKHGRASRKSRGKKSHARAVHRVASQTGILVQSKSGAIILDEHSDVAFNPASAIKLLTAFTALKKLGPEYRYPTSLLVDGELDEETGVFEGNVYVQGTDPDFKSSDGRDLLLALSEQGIKRINGKLIVSRTFSLNCAKDALGSGRGLARILRNGYAGERVTLDGSVAVGDAPSQAQLLVEHRSEELRETLKVMLSRSLNNAAERIGDSVGGLEQLKEAAREIGISPGSIHLESASGLGQNRMTPKQMMMVFTALGEELHKSGLDYQAILPVAGIDRGTLERRFTGAAERGSVVGKTGTLPGTDGGVSALVGIMRSKEGDLYFVHFGWRGGVCGFRSAQDSMIRQLQNERGGPEPFNYDLQSRTFEKQKRADVNLTSR
ncbi:MAG: D-alanyl-D-alanine carboxypeptidase, partial [Cyanobacteria bacterium]|nr:D-alanyl-D-alanine carboxypeptidase [Cyanobacteriota bacterium]